MRLRYLLPIAALLLLALILSPERIVAWATGEFGYRLAAEAVDDTRRVVIYDGRYRPLPYPKGDVPPNRGVCTDVVIRAYRGLGVDLQKLVHETFGGDRNIDHRRVPVLMRFFARHGQSLPVTDDPSNYKPGDIVAYKMTGAGLDDHIAIVSARRSWDLKRPLIVHNEGFGPKLDDALFAFRITGHYRYRPRVD
jgi:hypothetical protein